eukprot:CAMPEP_0185028448 /NCGR_PEP_ID=MMETSP1103-20130426/14169_1 /TAXON_ID=36769 /ORGANISM="Paraphysomonas bandaiensis, Strain Caron Lab Isolate" /LENGTH=265 /DNA_ID=CAMNT_0027562873 /DNA_START=57 /DNA_END=854 /DNA_ORIENTATION=-
MTHDAATGDISRSHIVSEWAQTQNIGLYGQLDCGARSFDYRPYYFNGTLYAHHGGVKINKPMKEAVTEVIEWCNIHTSELVVFYVNSCDGDDGCREAAIDLLVSLGIYTITDCSELTGLSVEDAISLSTLSGGGSLLGLYDCVSEQYDSTVNCYGKGYACYESWDRESTDIPWDKMQSYLIGATKEVPTTDGRLWMAQAHWQSTAESIAIGTLHNSSLLLDESRSNMNGWMAEAITKRTFQHLNIVEVDNVCDNGIAIYNAIKAL